MSISSMTGFARIEGSLNGWSWTAEARSVNGKGLDIRLRLPQGCEALDQPIKKAARGYLNRGNLQVNLALDRGNNDQSLSINQALLDQVVEAAKAIKASSGASGLTVDGILSIKGIIETTDVDDSGQEARDSAILESFGQLFDTLNNARLEEGARLQGILEDQIATVEKLVAQAEALGCVGPDAFRARLKAMTDELIDGMGLKIDEARLAQEAALLFTKADVREELDRLRGHIDAARDLLASQRNIGRKFDFLAQEFHREANTLCSKSSDPQLTDIGLALKTVIDQMREQVQNVE